MQDMSVNMVSTVLLKEYDLWAKFTNPHYAKRLSFSNCICTA